MKAAMIRTASWVPSPERQGTISIGTIIDHPEAWLLVQLGYAEPADDECAAKANMTPERMRIAQEECEMRERGIHPDDRDAYRSGEMTGYDADGNPIPGPNAEPDGEEDSVSIWLPEVFDNGG
jgi:hypothetical protein